MQKKWKKIHQKQRKVILKLNKNNNNYNKINNLKLKF